MNSRTQLNTEQPAAKHRPCGDVSLLEPPDRGILHRLTPRSEEGASRGLGRDGEVDSRWQSLDVQNASLECSASLAAVFLEVRSVTERTARQPPEDSNPHVQRLSSSRAAEQLRQTSTGA
ncbi:hypothetical protein AAFF_G00347880 [Aldrovandia affinis]|uniref:Uncharacterized protein n=1 Tax=Aldrovandia affinis TaxID=143900 RepID=A0AAD7WP67_9TELE|nr:hypothetical protein AAFF_G00347880 [Aldrovandia affinis]